jgi:ribosome-associated protein
MAEALRVSERVVIPEAALSVRAVRSSGPGGQNVNKVASKVELRVDLDRIQGLDPAARARLASLTAPRQDAEGRLVVVSQRTRDQHRNLEDAREKVRALVARCLVAPRARRPSRPTRAAREARIQAKKRDAERKRRRSRPATDDD